MLEMVTVVVVVLSARVAIFHYTLPSFTSTLKPGQDMKSFQSTFSLL